MPFVFGIRRAEKRTHSSSFSDITIDSLNGSLAEVWDFDVLLTSINSCGQQLLNAIPQIQNAPSDLMNILSAAYNEKSVGGQLVARLNTQLNACLSRVTSGMPHLEEMLRLVQQTQSQIASIREALSAFEASRASKARSEQELNLLMKRNRRRATTQEKSLHMKARSLADEEFMLCSDNARRLINGVLYDRWSNTAAALTGLCHCFACMFDAPPDLASDLLKSVAQLPPVSKPCENCTEEEEDNEVQEEYLPPITSLSTLGGASQNVMGDVHLQANTAGSQHESNHKSTPFSMTGIAPPPLPDTPPLPPLPPEQDSVRHDTSNITISSFQAKYVEGEKVKVWSSSKNLWLEGIVKEVFTNGGTYEGCRVPAGTIKVQFVLGIKFILPEHQDDLLREL